MDAVGGQPQTADLGGDPVNGQPQITDFRLDIWSLSMDHLSLMIHLLTLIDVSAAAVFRSLKGSAEDASTRLQAADPLQPKRRLKVSAPYFYPNKSHLQPVNESSVIDGSFQEVQN